MGSLLHGAQHAAGRPQTLPVTGLPWPVSFLFLQLLGAPGVPTSLSLLPGPWCSRPPPPPAPTSSSSAPVALSTSSWVPSGRLETTESGAATGASPVQPLSVPLLPSVYLSPRCLSRCVIICFVFSPQYMSLLGFCVCLYVLDNCLVGCKSHEGRGLAPPVHSPPEPETAPGTARALSRCSLIG